MEKKSGVSETAASLPGGGGGIRSIGDTFQPNLAMGGGSYKVPIELPQGPGGFSPKFEMLYSTGYGNGPLGLGWSFSVPFIERRRKSPFLPPGEEEYAVSGAEVLVPQGDGSYVPFIQQAAQSFRFDGGQWASRGANLVEMRFGSAPASRVEGTVDGVPRVSRWLLDRITFPGGRHVDFEYGADGAQRYLRTLRWSVFRLEITYEARPDPFSQFDTGFEIRTARRAAGMTVHFERLGPDSGVRVYRFEYRAAERTGASLLTRIHAAAFRFESGTPERAELPPLTFGYSRFDPAARGIVRLRSDTVPPPALGDDATLLDYRGTALPGVLRMNGDEATYWENLGNLRWGPPQRLAALPQGLHLGEDAVRFADLTGNGTADLLLARADGGGFYPHDPEQGFTRKRSVALAPSFDLGEEGSFLLDLDGDRVADLLTFRNGTPLAFFNEEQGEAWRGPVVLPSEDFADLSRARHRLRFADMTGDGQPDMVFLISRRVVYRPALGNGRWGAPRVMAHTPDFDVPDPDDNVFLADVDGDGTADLILAGNGAIRIYLNAGGERFAEPIVLNRTPRLGSGRFLLADMTGSGTTGFLWTAESAAGSAHEYWYLDPLNGVKPYLLSSVDNGAGLAVSIEYTTSAFERAADLAAGVRWSGYLPFAVHVVRRMIQEDSVTGQREVSEFRYHDGHYDGRTREYLGFARVDSIRRGTGQEAAVHQRYSFHNRGQSGDDPGFLAGKGQPRRTELLDPATGEIRQIEEAVWEARPVATADPARPAYLALETSRRSRRLEDGDVYEEERIEFSHDAAGNLVREHRRGLWTDSAGTLHDDPLIIEHTFASHPVHGLTSFPCRLKKTDGAGRVIKHISFFYDGPAFQGLPFGQAENGFRTRQSEIALTSAEITEAYSGVAPPLLASLYQVEDDPELGQVFSRDTRRYQVDPSGNQTATLDALGHRITLTYDADGVSPRSLAEEGGPARAFEFDPIAQQVRRVEDLNGHVTETRYDGFGRIVAVYRPGARPGMPTETYEYSSAALPSSVVQRTRVLPDDVEPGSIRFEYRDGAGRACQVKMAAEVPGRWAVEPRTVRSIAGRELAAGEAWFSDSPAFEPVPPASADAPAGLAERRRFFDFAGRLVREETYAGDVSVYEHVRNETLFYGPERGAARLADPAVLPTRINRTDAFGNIVSVEEADEDGRYEMRREYDALGRLSRIVDPLGHTVLRNAYDLWGNILRSDSAEAGTSVFVYDAGNFEVQRTDADGRVVFTRRDAKGRPLEVREGGPAGPLQETFQYDTAPGETSGRNLAGRLARVEGAFGSAEYSYSADGDSTRIRRTFAGRPETFEVGFEYDHQRQVRAVVYPDGARVDYHYFANGKLAAVPGYIDSITYTASGHRARVAFANGLETLRTLSPGDGLLVELLTRPAASGPAYQHCVYSLDAVGQVVRVDDLSTVPGKMRNDQTFQYDSRNRLVRATGRGAAGFYDYAYRHDPLGNLIFSGESFGQDMDYGHHLGDAAHPNRLIKRRAAPAPEYRYDAAGNLVRDPALGSLIYDARHRLVRIERPDGALVEYRYDHNDHRTETRVTKDGATTVRHEVEGLYLLEPGGAVKVVIDDQRRLAVIPTAGDALLHHHDRLGNVNVVSNLATGAFVGHDEYTPFGLLSVSMVLEPHFTFQGARFSDGLDLVLLGARHYRPALGRFLTPDFYLLTHPEKIPGLIAASNLTLYGLSNPVCFTDPAGQIAFLLVIGIAALVGAAIGGIAAAMNGVSDAGEIFLWMLGGAIGAVLTVLLGAWLGPEIFCGTATNWAIRALVFWGATSLIGALFTPVLDDSNSKVVWAFSFFLKWLSSPILNTVVLLGAGVAAVFGSRVDFRRGSLFVEAGPGMNALTLGVVAWTQRGWFNADGTVRDDLARHEATHTRTVAALGWIGFYVTYITIGGLWGAIESGSALCWFAVNSRGEGNPFEKEASRAVAGSC